MEHINYNGLNDTIVGILDRIAHFSSFQIPKSHIIGTHDMTVNSKIILNHALYVGPGALGVLGPLIRGV